jgi:hypothetical protein
MAVAHLLLQHSAATGNAARNRVVPPAILLVLQLLCGGLELILPHKRLDAHVVINVFFNSMFFSLLQQFSRRTII